MLKDQNAPIRLQLRSVNRLLCKEADFTNIPPKISEKLGSGVGLTKRPIGRCDVGGNDGSAVAGGDPEGEGLAVEEGVALPILPPIPRHRLPPRPRPLNLDGVNFAGAADVGDEYEVKVGVAVDCEPNPSFLPACHPSKRDGDDAGLVVSDLLEDGLGEVEVAEGRVAPTAGVVREGVVGRAEVGGGDDDGAREAPAVVVDAADLEAGAAAEAVVEEGGAQRRRARAVPLAVQVPVPTRSPHCAGSISAAVEGGVGIHPSFQAVPICNCKGK